MPQILIHQIFYDETTRRQVDPEFIPLDNCMGGRPDWFEFLPILRFLESNQLDPDAWYGFLSPRFKEKTGCTGSGVKRTIEQCAGSEPEAFLFSPGWDQIAYFRNVFEQGEFFHPGLTSIAQQFFDRVGMKVDLCDLVSHLGNAVFGNYIIARPSFWREWQGLATQYFQIAESRTDSLGHAISGTTPYGTMPREYPMKTFIQERLASVLLATGKYTVVNVDFSTSHAVFDALFDVGDANREKLSACNVAKRNYCKSKDARYLEEYYRLRGEVQTTFGGGASFRDAPAFGVK